MKWTFYEAKLIFRLGRYCAKSCIIYGNNVRIRSYTHKIARLANSLAQPPGGANPGPVFEPQLPIQVWDPVPAWMMRLSRFKPHAWWRNNSLFWALLFVILAHQILCRLTMGITISILPLWRLFFCNDGIWGIYEKPTVPFIDLTTWWHCIRKLALDSVEDMSRATWQMAVGQCDCRRCQKAWGGLVMMSV